MALTFFEHRKTRRGNSSNIFPCQSLFHVTLAFLNVCHPHHMRVVSKTKTRESKGKELKKGSPLCSGHDAMAHDQRIYAMFGSEGPN